MTKLHSGVLNGERCYYLDKQKQSWEIIKCLYPYQALSGSVLEMEMKLREEFTMMENNLLRHSK